MTSREVLPYAVREGDDQQRSIAWRGEGRVMVKIGILDSGHRAASSVDDGSEITAVAKQSANGCDRKRSRRRGQSASHCAKQAAGSPGVRGATGDDRG